MAVTSTCRRCKSSLEKVLPLGRGAEIEWLRQYSWDGVEHEEGVYCLDCTEFLRIRLGPQPTHARCSRCDQIKPLQKFRVRSGKPFNRGYECLKCGRERARVHWRRNKEERRKRQRETYWKIRRGAIDRLGGSCVNCGIGDIRVLQINHLNGGGRQESYSLGHGNLGAGARNLWKAIVSGNRNLDDLEVRCANCNILYEYEIGRRGLGGIDQRKQTVPTP